MSILDVLNPTDTHGLPISGLKLSLNHGLLSKFTGGSLADLLWTTQKFFGWMTGAILNIVSAFNWLTPVVNLLEKVSDAISETFGTIGVFAVGCAIMLMVATVHWMRNTTHRIGYHLGMAVLLILIGVFMVSPVRFAAQAVSLGGAVATDIGQRATGSDQSATISQILATKYQREPLFRANYGANLDDIAVGPGRTCGDVYDEAIRAGVPADDIKEEILHNCGDAGDRLHAYADNPDNINFDLMIALGSTALLGLFVLIVCIRVVISGVATVWHAAAVKPLLTAVMAGPTVQVLALRNVIAIPLGGLAVAGDLLVIVLGAAFTSFIAVATGSSAIASLIDSLIMIGLIVGTWRFSRNLRGSGRSISEQIARANSPSSSATLSRHNARQAVTRVVTNSVALASTLAGQPAAGTAVSALGNGVLSRPRSNQLLHQRGHYGQPGYHPPAMAPAGQPAAGNSPYPGHPVAAAAQVAYRIQYSQPAPMTHQPATNQPGLPARPAVIPSLIPTGAPARQPQPRQQHQSAGSPPAAPRVTPIEKAWPPEKAAPPRPSAKREFIETPLRQHPPLSIPSLNPDGAQHAADAAAAWQRRPQPPGATP